MRVSTIVSALPGCCLKPAGEIVGVKIGDAEARLTDVLLNVIADPSRISDFVLMLRAVPLPDCIRDIMGRSGPRQVADWIAGLRGFDRVSDLSTMLLCPIGLYQHRSTRQQIAVKLFPKLDRDKEQLFIREVETLARHSGHPCIVPFFG
jgi:hypothetical protein